MKLVYPKNQLIWVHQYNKGGELQFLITSDTNRLMYYLYKWENEKFIKIKSSKLPIFSEICSKEGDDH